VGVRGGMMVMVKGRVRLKERVRVGYGACAVHAAFVERSLACNVVDERAEKANIIHPIDWLI
jgi:hypothetical protein